MTPSPRPPTLLRRRPDGLLTQDFAYFETVSAALAGIGRLFLGTLFVLSTVAFTWLGWRDLQTQIGLKERGTVTTATVASFEGSFWTGRRARVENFNYWVEYDGHRYLWLANIPSAQKPLTLATPLGTLQAMRGGFRTGAAVRAAQATRIDLLLETLALRHQLGVLARSHRRFRPTDRLLWLFLRWLWPRWREALVLAQPATVDRWHREGVRRCWRRRAGRPGRPRIDSSCRDLIRRMAAENCLCGAPRIHGELLKLGIAISERTVSRYLRGRPPTRSQTWRTFFANFFGDRTLISPVIFADASGDDIVIDASDVSFRSALSIDASCASSHGPNVDWVVRSDTSLACV